MTKKTPILLFVLITILACHTDADDEVSLIKTTFNFNHNWDHTEVTNNNFNLIQYSNSNGEELSIKKLRYLISKITFTSDSGEKIVLDGYHLVDLTNAKNLSFVSSTKIPVGTYPKVSFTFGFNNEDNYNHNYPDLNATSWNVPEMLGGGYHFMQLEGSFISNTTVETGFAYHSIRAIDNSSSIPVFENTFFEVDLGSAIITNDTLFNINMNIAEWFKNPNKWNLNTQHSMLMSNFEAQIMMYENGQNVFSLESIVPTVF